MKKSTTMNLDLGKPIKLLPVEPRIREALEELELTNRRVIRGGKIYRKTSKNKWGGSDLPMHRDP